MPNYYIQATKGHFNPLSFDELVKPLNMYKEYYDENEKAVTEMRSQADLWDEIMKSEGDTDLANKYNQYSQGLNDAAQQLSNGMSYNFRKQIQDLRAKSAMVKQIENAYTLRAKDIDAYNELMIKDPSRIGAFDPSQRKLQEYMRGPVTNEYGVSGDRLFTLGAAEAKAYAERNVNFRDTIDKYGQFIERAKSQGLTNEEIGAQLENEFSDLSQMAKSIMTQEGATFNNPNDYYRALTYTINGMLSGATYDETRTYNPYGEYMNKYQEQSLELQREELEWKKQQKQSEQDKKDLENIIKELQNTHQIDFGVLKAPIKNQLENGKLFYNGEKNVADDRYNVFKDLFAGTINNSDIITNGADNNIITKELYDLYTYYVKNDDDEYEEVLDKKSYDDLINLIKTVVKTDDPQVAAEAEDAAKESLLEGIKDKKEKDNIYTLYNELYEIYSILEDVPGKNDIEKYTKLVDYYNTIDEKKISGIDYYEDETKAAKVKKIISEKILNNAECFKFDKEKGFSEKPETMNDKMKKAISESLVATDYGYLAKVGSDVYLIQTADVDANNYNITMSTLNDLLNVEKMKTLYRESEKDDDGYILLRNGYLLKIEDGKYKIKTDKTEPATINLYNAGELYNFINSNVVKESKRLYKTAVGD